MTGRHRAEAADPFDQGDEWSDAQEWAYLPDGDPRAITAAEALLVSPLVVPGSMRFAIAPNSADECDVVICWYQEVTATGTIHRMRELSA
ncbi:hypothetical protein P9139_06260 [Curtobacterium flaccumfaciens]|nr:hypothetical protein P9139_06260 [Curtobacterium flaccumfaciens]